MAAVDYLLLNGEAWLQYAVRINLLHEKKSALTELKETALQDDKIKGYLQDVSDYHGQLVRNHKNPALPIHKLHFLLDVGFDASVTEIDTAINEIMKHKHAQGVYQSLTNIPTQIGGMGEDILDWFLCDSTLLLLGVLNAGVSYAEYSK